jgi:hypothetical protein
MISHLASPAVCVIDDESQDYGPILTALNALHISCVHLTGEVEGMPEQPFGRLRLLFLDLHLSGTVGKAAASYTANVFTHIVPADTAPIVVVIWSKYADDPVQAGDIPPEDQETEAELFCRTVLEAQPAYEGRVIFVQMPKPKPDARPADWVTELKAAIADALKDQPAIEALWAWDALVKNAATEVTTALTAAAQTARDGTPTKLGDALKATLQKLTSSQGEGDLSEETAPFHMSTVLSQLLTDQLEHADRGDLAVHGVWLSEAPNPAPAAAFSASMNGVLLAADLPPGATAYGPGTVYRVSDDQAFTAAFGVNLQGLADHCFGKGIASLQIAGWRTAVRPILLEVSPVCDVAQSKRINATLVAGVVVPLAMRDLMKKNVPSLSDLPPFKLRWAVAGFAEQDVCLMVSHFFKYSVPAGTATPWLTPWFRLRELPTTSIRNANAAQAARVGYVSVS